MKENGKKNLNLTDRDMQLLSESVSKIKFNRELKNISQPIEEESYYLDYEKMKRYPETVFSYGFDNAGELVSLLDTMWTFQGKEDIKALIPNCVASTYKYLDICEKKYGKAEISPFIYEF